MADAPTSSGPVTVRLQGGMGNQMFQYAAGRCVAARLQAPLILDLAWFHAVRNAPGVTPRSYALDAFGIQAELQQRSGWLTSAPHLVQRLARPVLHRLVREQVYRETPNAFDPGFRQLRSPVTLDGYFQSELYFAPIAEEIRASFRRRGPISAESADLLSQIEQDTSVAVHIRRGDYVTNAAAAEFHGLCDIDYYRAGLRYLASELGAFRVFVFTDDPAWALENLDFGVETLVLPGPGSRPDHEDLWLMAACHSFVIANSSFSWWGAWLGEHEDKRVVAPQRWFLDPSRGTSELLPGGWVQF